jgi:aryl-alcohol dehydrogenase-like predicted oxidoreductase
MATYIRNKIGDLPFSSIASGLLSGKITTKTRRVVVKLLNCGDGKGDDKFIRK